MQKKYSLFSMIIVFCDEVYNRETNIISIRNVLAVFLVQIVEGEEEEWNYSCNK